MAFRAQAAGWTDQGEEEYEKCLLLLITQMIYEVRFFFFNSNFIDTVI